MVPIILLLIPYFYILLVFVCEDDLITGFEACDKNSEGPNGLSFLSPFAGISVPQHTPTRSSRCLRAIGQQLLDRQKGLGDDLALSRSDVIIMPSHPAVILMIGQQADTKGACIN